MIYISPNNEYPRHYGDIQLENPEWQLGDNLPDGWMEVAQVNPPEQQTNKVIYEEFPIEIDGVMTQNWQVRDMTAEEIEIANAPETAKAKLLALGLTEVEIQALVSGLVR